MTHYNNQSSYDNACPGDNDPEPNYALEVLKDKLTFIEHRLDVSKLEEESLDKYWKANMSSLNDSISKLLRDKHELVEAIDKMEGK